MISMRVNGEETDVAFSPYKTLLEVLREALGLNPSFAEGFAPLADGMVAAIRGALDDTGHQQRCKSRGHQGQRPIVEPEDAKGQQHQRGVDNGRQGGAADGLPHVFGVVGARENLANLTRFEEPHR